MLLILSHGSVIASVNVITSNEQVMIKQYHTSGHQCCRAKYHHRLLLAWKERDHEHECQRSLRANDIQRRPAAAANHVPRRSDTDGNSANYTTQPHSVGYVNYLRLPRHAAQPCPVSMQCRIWCEQVIRIPVRRSDTQS